jgi:hypothetical protein
MLRGAPLSRHHTRRLREVYRSAGWPSQDAIEVDLLAAGLLERVSSGGAAETLRLTDAGIAVLADSLARNRAVLDAHEALVGAVARQMQHAGRIVFTGLSLRARVPVEPGEELGVQQRWCVARPDVFSVRNTSKESFLAPAVHEVKVKRADVLGELRRHAKRAAYLDMSSETWFVLGRDAKGREIADASELPAEFGVLQQAGATSERLELVRPAPRRARTLPFGVWLALAKATPLAVPDEAQQRL